MQQKSIAIASVRILLAAVIMALTGPECGVARAQVQHIIVVDPDRGNSADSGEQSDEGTQEPKIRTSPPAYDEQMLRLAEILGSLHYLRELCGADEGQLWRQQMEEMLKKEEPTEKRRLQLVARFNRGFRGYREIYRECTASAAEAANRFLRQGIRIAAEIPGRYGN